MIQGGLFDELVVDNFAGGGGASTGIEAAIGRPVDIAINHDPEAVAMHAANHPHTQHHCENIWDVDPVEATAGRPVGLAWFSPDCTHFSRAKGTQPRQKRIRGLAWVVIRWAAKVRPRVIMLENVEEFATWGPLRDGRPCPDRRGETFRTWVSQLEDLGYVVEWRALAACDYGAPTTRRRLYLIARCDGEPIAWPEPTHGPDRAESYRTAAECIDWSLECPSIFTRRRPLAEATQRRIAEGLRRFVVETEAPFIIRHGHYSKRTGAGLRPGCGAGTWRGQRLEEPLATVCATNDKNLVLPHLQREGETSSTPAPLVAAWMAKHYSGVVGHGFARPIGTITAQDHHAVVEAALHPGKDRSPEVAAFLTKYYGTAVGSDLREPLHTITSRDRFGLVVVAGLKYRITDIGMRMLAPRELYRAQAFPESTEIAPRLNGKPITKTAQLRLCGNSVVPLVAQQLVAANVDVREMEGAA